MVKLFVARGAEKYRENSSSGHVKHRYGRFRETQLFPSGMIFEERGG